MHMIYAYKSRMRKWKASLSLSLSSWPKTRMWLKRRRVATSRCDIPRKQSIVIGLLTGRLPTAPQSKKNVGTLLGVISMTDVCAFFHYRRGDGHSGIHDSGDESAKCAQCVP